MKTTAQENMNFYGAEIERLNIEIESLALLYENRSERLDNMNDSDPARGETQAEMSRIAATARLREAQMKAARDLYDQWFTEVQRTSPQWPD